MEIEQVEVMIEDAIESLPVSEKASLYNIMVARLGEKVPEDLLLSIERNSRKKEETDVEPEVEKTFGGFDMATKMNEDDSSEQVQAPAEYLHFL